MNYFLKFSSANVLKFNFKSVLRRHFTIRNQYFNRVEQLRERGLLRAHGSDVSAFLQGLMTNDMKHIEGGAVSMYTMFLNVRGRVLCDAIIYQESEETFLIETDKEALPTLQKHLKMYRVRRKIDLDIDENFKVWVYFGSLMSKNCVNLKQISSEAIKENKLEYDDSLKSLQKEAKITCRDPRLAELGYRLIVPTDKELNVQLSNGIGSCESYKVLRYKLGVGEGVSEIPPGKSFPMELNCDFLHGVSFHKGCYIGQELTARVYHTGVIRKRFMPLVLDTPSSETFVIDAVIENAMNRKPVGKLRGLENNYGLGLMRIDEALKSPALSILNGMGYAIKPNWWPQEAPKERSVAGKE